MDAFHIQVNAMMIMHFNGKQYITYVMSMSMRQSVIAENKLATCSITIFWEKQYLLVMIHLRILFNWNNCFQEEQCFFHDDLSLHKENIITMEKSEHFISCIIITSS